MLRAVKRELKSTWSVEVAVTVRKYQTWVSCLALLYVLYPGSGTSGKLLAVVLFFSSIQFHDI